MKYYAVKKGKKPGIYESWDECKEQVSGYNGAEYKSFKTKNEALLFLEGKEEEIDLSIPVCYVDGSFDSKTESYSFGGVFITKDGLTEFKKAFPKDEYSSHRNVAGEIKGAAYVINYAKKRGYKKIKICYDYEGIEKWYTGLWQANTKITQDYVNFRESVKNDIEVVFEKIKGHSNNKYNDAADRLAKAALGIK